MRGKSCSIGIYIVILTVIAHKIIQKFFPSLHEKECIYQTMLSHTGLCEEVQLETCGSNSPPYPRKGQIPHSFRTGNGQMLGCVPQDWRWTFGIPWLVHVKHACVCSSRARWPVAPNFCSWATRNLSFFIGIIDAGHTGFHKFRALGSHQFFLEHSLALYIGVIMIIIK